MQSKSRSNLIQMFLNQTQQK